MNPSFNDIYFLVRGVAVLVLLSSLLGFLAGFLACHLSGGRAPGLPKRPAAPQVTPVETPPVPQTYYPRPVHDTGLAPPPLPEEVAEPLGPFERLAAMGDAWEEERKRKAHDEELPAWAQP